MKKLFFNIFLLVTFNLNLYCISIELLDNEKIINTRSDFQSNLKMVYFQNNLILIHSQKTEIFLQKKWQFLFNSIEDSAYLDTYAKYGVSSMSFIDKEKKHFYIETKSRLDESIYYCYEFSFLNEELLRKTLNRIEFESIKSNLLDIWQEFPIVLDNESELQFFRKAIAFGSYNHFFQIVSKNGQILDIKGIIPEYDILIRPCINERKNRIAFLGCRKEDVEARLFNNCNVFIFSIIYDATLNDTRVRLRSEPNLSCETLDYLEKGESVKIVDRTDDKFKIDGEDWYWYQVKTKDEQSGWIYGKYLDIEE